MLLKNLFNAAASLQNAIEIYDMRKKNLASENEMKVLEAGVIQNFEFTYELCWKLIKRWLKENVSPDCADGITRRELFRLAFENKLINNVEDWMQFHNAINFSSHIYDKVISDEILEYCFKFLPYAKELYENLERHHD